MEAKQQNLAQKLLLVLHDAMDSVRDDKNGCEIKSRLCLERTVIQRRHDELKTKELTPNSPTVCLTHLEPCRNEEENITEELPALRRVAEELLHVTIHEIDKFRKLQVPKSCTCSTLK